MRLVLRALERCAQKFYDADVEAIAARIFFLCTPSTKQSNEGANGAIHKCLHLHKSHNPITEKMPCRSEPFCSSFWSSSCSAALADFGGGPFYGTGYYGGGGLGLIHRYPTDPGFARQALSCQRLRNAKAQVLRLVGFADGSSCYGTSTFG